MSDEFLIHPYDLALTMAYAEKPYRDLALTGEKSEHEKRSLDELANYAGVAAAREYIASLDTLISHY